MWNVSGVGEKGTRKSYSSATCKKKGKNSLPDFIRISHKFEDGKYKNGMKFSLIWGTHPHRKSYVRKGEQHGL